MALLVLQISRQRYSKQTRSQFTHTPTHGTFKQDYRQVVGHSSPAQISAPPFDFLEKLLSLSFHGHFCSCKNLLALEAQKLHNFQLPS